MGRSLVWCAVGVLAVIGLVPKARGGESAEAHELFEARVRPLLAQHCWECHAEETQESELRLDRREALVAGGLSGRAAVVPGEPDQSLLIEAIGYEGELQMPPGGRLSDKQIAVLRLWVELGAPWPESAERLEDPLRQRITDDRQFHWAYQPVQRPEWPQVASPQWCGSPMDRFVLARLESRGVEPSAPADRRTLLRRLSFGLTGLPPQPEQLHRFRQDARPDAYARQLDRLLASPRYGERWGRHWLDVARYADTRGYAFARERRFPFAWTYRDYVLDAWNADLPFDQFIVEQLAADQLALGEDRSALAALGFLTVGRRFNNVHDDIDDRIDVVSRGFLGLTVACARCHDHKYDAIPTEDYYSLYGVFASCHEPSDMPLIGQSDEVEAYREYLGELEQRKSELEKFASARHAELLEHGRERVGEYLAAVVSGNREELLEQVAFLSVGRDDLRPRLVRDWYEYFRREAGPSHPTLMPWYELSRLASETFAESAAELAGRWKGLSDQQLNPLVRDRFLERTPATRREIAEVYSQLLAEAYRQWKEQGASDRALAKLPDAWRQVAMLLFSPQSPAAIPRDKVRDYLCREDREQYNSLQKQIDQHQVDAPPELPRAMVVQDRDQPTEPVVFMRGNHGRPGQQVPRQFLAVLEGPQRQPFSQGSGRLELARAIASRDNPLTARVIVNRVWMHHFGEPLVESPSDFGVRTDPPLQRDLLDYLAWRLMEENWSIKALQREILLSSTYRQSSVFRQEAYEEDPENRLLWRRNRQRLEFEPLRDSLLHVAGVLDPSMGGKPVDIFQPPYSHRRTVYAEIDRQDLPNLLRVFDFASPDQSSPMRPRTTVPQQALFLMNSPFLRDISHKLLERPELQQAGGLERVRRVYQLLFQRDPTQAERELAGGFLGQDQAGADRWAAYVQLLLMSNEFSFID